MSSEKARKECWPRANVTGGEALLGHPNKGNDVMVNLIAVPERRCPVTSVQPHPLNRNNKNSLWQ